MNFINFQKRFRFSSKQSCLKILHFLHNNRHEKWEKSFKIKINRIFENLIIPQFLIVFYRKTGTKQNQEKFCFKNTRHCIELNEVHAQTLKLCNHFRTLFLFILHYFSLKLFVLFFVFFWLHLLFLISLLNCYFLRSVGFMY